MILRFSYWLVDAIASHLPSQGNPWLTLSLSLVDFDSFLKVLNRPGGFREPGEPEEYCRGFQVFDKDMTGFIGVGQLRYSMFCPAQLACAWKGGC